MTRYCEECGCDVQEVVQVFPGHLRKECAECGSTGAFMAENPHYGPGNPDFERDLLDALKYGDSLAMVTA